MARVTREQQRLFVAQALLNLQRVDVLSESGLVELLAITPSSSGYWSEGTELAERVTTAAQTTLSKLHRLPRYEAHRQLLEAVLQGSSISAWAKARGMRREHISRTLWAQVTSLVTQEVIALRPARR